MTSPAPAVRPTRGQTRNLGAGHLAFAVTFWAWNLIAPLGVRYTKELGLSARARRRCWWRLPVLVGSLGRIVVGALTDRFGGRLMFTVLLLRLDRPRAAGRASPATATRYGLLLVFGVLPRHRRHDVRRRHPLRQRLVRADAARASPPACSAPAWAARRCRRSSPPVRQLVRLHRDPRDHRRRRWPSTAASCWFDDARLAALVAQHRPRRAQARRGAASCRSRGRCPSCTP